jgi:hypothetical protein
MSLIYTNQKLIAQERKSYNSLRAFKLDINTGFGKIK